MKDTTKKSEKALLVISFGTTHHETRQKTIDASEKALAEAFPQYDLKRAFTAQKIIKILKERDGIEVDSVRQAIEKIYQAGYREVLAQPLHVINGSEFHDLIHDLALYSNKFEQFAVGAALLTSQKDYQDMVQAISAVIPDAGEREAIIFMGHGTEHPANTSYAALDYTFKRMGYKHCHIGTVEGSPRLDDVIDQLEADEIRKVTLMPLMVVAGEHAKNDMAGDEEDSWKNLLEAAGYQVDTLLIGLGELEGIQSMYIEHARSAEKHRYFN